MLISLKRSIKILSIHLHSIQINFPLVQIWHYHQLLGPWNRWWAVNDVRELVTTDSLQWRIDFNSIAFFQDKDVVVFTIELLLSHVSLMHLHQVNSNFDHVVIVVDVISDERKSFRLKHSLEIGVVQVVLKYHFVFLGVPYFQINCIFPAFYCAVRTHDEYQVLSRLIDVETHKLKLLRNF